MIVLENGLLIPCNPNNIDSSINTHYLTVGEAQLVKGIQWHYVQNLI